jgi:hypothetical protein
MKIFSYIPLSLIRPSTIIKFLKKQKPKYQYHIVYIAEATKSFIGSMSISIDRKVDNAEAVVEIEKYIKTKLQTEGSVMLLKWTKLKKIRIQGEESTKQRLKDE